MSNEPKFLSAPKGLTIPTIEEIAGVLAADKARLEAMSASERNAEELRRQIVARSDYIHML
jgi:hypothetical protein